MLYLLADLYIHLPLGTCLAICEMQYSIVLQSSIYANLYVTLCQCHQPCQDMYTAILDVD